MEARTVYRRSQVLLIEGDSMLQALWRGFRAGCVGCDVVIMTVGGACGKFK